MGQLSIRRSEEVNGGSSNPEVVKGLVGFDRTQASGGGGSDRRVIAMGGGSIGDKRNVDGQTGETAIGNEPAAAKGFVVLMRSQHE
jgi:hypothetical protein